MATAPPRDLEAELRDWTGWPESWRPTEQDPVLVGVVEGYSTGKGKFGPVRVAQVRKQDGSRVSLWIGSAALLAQFRDQKPRKGEKIGVRWLGKSDTGAHRYRLVVDRQEELPDFSPVGGEDLSEEELPAGSYAAVTGAAPARNQPRPPRTQPSEPCDEDPFDE